MFTNSREIFAPWVLLLEQESYLSLSHIKKVMKRILQTAEPYTIILKDELQITLDIIMGENQSATIKEIEQWDIFFSTIRDIIFVSKPSVELIGIFSFLLCKSSNTETILYT